VKNLVTALLAVQAAAGYVQKKAKNDHHKYWYAAEADILAVVRPAMIENGLVLIGPTVVGDERQDEHGNLYVTLEWRLAHSSGEVWPEPLRVIGAGNDKSGKSGAIGDKAIYKAYTGAVKYMLAKFLFLATGDDPENEAAGTFAPQQGEPPAPKREAPREEAPVPREAASAALDAGEPITDETRDTVTRLFKDFGYTTDKVANYLKTNFGVDFARDLTEKDGRWVMDMLREQIAKSRPADSPMASDDQKAKIAEQMKRVGWSNEDGVAYLADTFGKTSRKDLTATEASEMIHHLRDLPAARKAS
jgi:hypothetical protein